MAGSGREGLNSPAQGGGAMAGIFTYVTGNWNIYLHGRKFGITRKWTERQEHFSTWQEVGRKAEFSW